MRASTSPPTLYPVEDRPKDEHGGEVRGRVQRVAEEEGGEHHREHLARGHHDREDHLLGARARLRVGVVGFGFGLGWG